MRDEHPPSVVSTLLPMQASCWSQVVRGRRQTRAAGRGDVGLFVRPLNWTEQLADERAFAAALHEDHSSVQTAIAPFDQPNQARLSLLRMPPDLHHVAIPLGWCTHHLWLVAPPLIAPLPCERSASAPWAGPITWTFLALAGCLAWQPQREDSPRQRAQALVRALGLIAPTVTVVLPLPALTVIETSQPRATRACRLPSPHLLAVDLPTSIALAAADAALLQRLGLRLDPRGLQRWSGHAADAPMSEADWQRYGHWQRCVDPLAERPANRANATCRWFGWATKSWHSSATLTDRGAIR